VAKSLAELGVAPALLSVEQAAEYLGVSIRHMWELRLARVDIRSPGSKRAAWRYQVSDLDAVIASRRVAAGSNVLAATAQVPSEACRPSSNVRTQSLKRPPAR
jgi:hypothetical protein